MAQAIDSTSRSECNSELRSLKVELCGREYQLGRNDVLDILTCLPPDRVKDLGAALVLGDWTTLPPCSLRRSRDSITGVFAHLPEVCAEVDEALARQAICARASGTNRHGHSAANPYPGAAGWTEEYARARPVHEAYVEQMRRYTEYATKSYKTFAEAGEVGRVIVRLISHFDDANHLASVEEAVVVLQKASTQARRLRAISVLAEMPESRLRMQKLRKGWRECQPGKKTERFSLS